MKTALALAIIATLSLGSAAKATSAAAPLPGKLVSTAQGEKVIPAVGVGAKRSLQIVVFPFVHPVEFAKKVSFPTRHPMVAFYRFGKGIEPYQPGLNSLGTAGGMAAPFVYGFKKN